MLGTLQVPLQLTADSSAILIGATCIHPFNDGELSHRIEPALWEKSGDKKNRLGGIDVSARKSQISMVR